jgi:hypothetical protein
VRGFIAIWSYSWQNLLELLRMQTLGLVLGGYALGRGF